MKNLKKIIKTSLLTGLTTLFLIIPATAVFAEHNIINIAPAGQFSSLRQITFGNITQSLITLGLVIAALIAFGFLIFGGITWITSGGDKAKTESARNTITAAVIGLLIVFGAWALIQLLELFFGVTILQLNISPVSTEGNVSTGSPACASACASYSSYSCVDSGTCAGGGGSNVGTRDCTGGEICCCWP